MNNVKLLVTVLIIDINAFRSDRCTAGRPEALGFGKNNKGIDMLCK